MLQKIGTNKFSLLGWSDGGISSLILAAKYPESVEKLVVWGSNAYVTPEEIQTYESNKNGKMVFLLSLIYNFDRTERYE